MLLSDPQFLSLCCTWNNIITTFVLRCHMAHVALQARTQYLYFEVSSDT